MFAAQHGDLPLVTLLLGAPGVELEAADHEGHTALAVAAAHGHPPVVDLLLHTGAHPERPFG